MQAQLTAITADLVVLLHLAFIVFVVLGGLPVLHWPRLAWLHIPCVLWGITVEWTGWICPLTPLENTLRRSAGGDAYGGGFIDTYIVPLIYPPGLTRETQWILGAVVIAVNLGVYTALYWRTRRR